MKNVKTKRTVWLAVTLLLVFSFAVAKEKYEEKFEKTMALAKDGKVDIGNISGDIVAMSWKQDQVRIEALKVSTAGSLEKAKENAAKVTIEIAQEGNVLRIETKYPRNEKSWGGESTNVSVNYKLWIPEKAALKAHSISGDVTAEAIGGAADLKAISGDVRLTKADEGAECNSISGEVVVAEVTGNAFLKSVSGDIKANMIKGSVEAETVSGDVELTDISEASSVRAKALSGEVIYRGRINRQGNYHFKSHSGDVELYLPADSAFDFEADTFSGGIETDFEVKVMGKVSPKEMSGTVNGGGASLKVSSFSGDIRLKKS
ncbi:MAG: DUF4097 family beta strand repeat-containing protein [Candidatus Aminicenantales bacterium]